ncbi:MAG: sugar phosphate isomerase/epimerase [Actinomycetota bacterium]|nr:sugar phosphate isomerase/epimerase [Actinomycetota bacterium]
MTSLVGLSTSSVFPEGTEAAFRIAADLGYDGVEVMVGTDASSQDSYALLDFVQTYQVPVLSIHSPCLLVTQRVWGTEPWGKLVRAQAVAEQLGARTVVVHPPFRWQRGYAQGFVEGLARMREETDIRFAVENMFPWRALSKEITAYAPGWDVRDEDYPHATVDLSHTAVSKTDAMTLVRDLGSRVAHLHLADGTGSARDEHLIPGRGSQPVAEVLGHLAHTGFTGNLIVEVNTRAAPNDDVRAADLAEALAFAREHSMPMAG